jgi:hypothetical protein
LSSRLERSGVEGSALKITPCNLLSAVILRSAATKDPRLLFHSFGWNTVPFPTAVWGLVVCLGISDTPHKDHSPDPPKASVPHPFDVFLSKGWETTDTKNSKGYRQMPMRRW